MPITKSTIAHGSCDANIEYVPTNAKGCQYPMRCKKHKKKGVGKWIKWATKKNMKFISRFKATVQTQFNPLSVCV